MKGVPAVENGDAVMSLMCNTNSIDVKLQRFSNASLSACCLCFKISSYEVGWRESVKLRTISIKPTCLKPEKCVMPLMKSVDLCCWRIPQFVSVELDRSALQHVVKIPSSSLENKSKFKFHLCMEYEDKKRTVWPKLKLCCPIEIIGNSRSWTMLKEMHQLWMVTVHSTN